MRQALPPTITFRGRVHIGTTAQNAACLNGIRVGLRLLATPVYELQV
jgi:hypothetical protein